MPNTITAKHFIERLKTHASPVEREKTLRYFKNTEGDDFVFNGRIGTGFDNEMLLDLRARLDKLEIEKTPFTKAVGLPRLRQHWVQPKIVVRVGFIEWTNHGKLRHPRLLSVVK